MPIISLHIRSFPGNTLAECTAGLLIFNEGLKEAAPARFGRTANRPVRAACAVLFLILMSSLWCFSADVVLIRSAGGPSWEQHELELATQFYGLNLKVVTASAHISGPELAPVQQNATLAVAIEANALAAVNQKALLRALHRELGGSVPLLIFGVTPETDPTLLSTWSGGAVVGANILASPGRLHYVVGSVVGITEQLTDLEIPFPDYDTFYFVLAGHSRAQKIMAVRSDHQVVPVFIEADFRQQKVFLLGKKRPPRDGAVGWSADSMVTAFAEIAPVMMFTKSCAGDRGWHALHHYANLTIDDPWLREPYGHLIYKGLLKEMEKHDFHTTIAFIPWNYDRSEAEVISLFRSHPERFSICIHGDNHDHKEFEDLRSKPLTLQLAALKQSLARMEKFQALTEIPYDSVFVFPHSIGSERILEELKTYNFLATINSSNVPMDRPRPASLPFALRPVTLSYADFPSITRYPAKMPNPSGFIGINEFLDNPLFFYSHHDLFASGMDAFDGMVDEVNKLEPDTRWRSVGDIVKHLYLVRQRDDSNYDVLTFSSSLDLNNTSGRDLIFYVQKQESGSPVMASVSVDGRHVPFQLRAGYLDLSVAVPAGEARSVVIQYKSDLNLASISTSRSSLRVYLLREISDFRDITVSKYYIGRALTDYYYIHGISLLIVIGCGCALIVFSCGTCLLVIMKRKSSVVLNRETPLTNRIARATRDACTRS